jgi:hypothetical protein
MYKLTYIQCMSVLGFTMVGYMDLLIEVIINLSDFQRNIYTFFYMH